MRRISFHFMLMLLSFLVGIALVGLWRIRHVQPVGDIQPLNIIAFTPRPTLSEKELQPIHQVDFLNFTYPNKSVNYRKFKNSITLENGEFQFREPKERISWLAHLSPEHISYSDLTGDGEDEAIIEIFSHSGASGGEYFFYIYTLKKEQPNLLWFFETYASGSDVGGHRDLTVENGELVLDLNGKNRIIGNRSAVILYECDVCYDEFSRVRFRWNGKSLRQRGKVEFHPLPDKQN